MKPNFCDHRFEVLTSDADARQQLKAHTLLCKMQDIANEHASQLHFGYEDMTPKGVAWVLSRMKVRFEKEIHWRDQVLLRTWHKGVNGVFSLRDFQIFSGKKPEEVLVSATTSWLIINLENRRMQRADHVIGQDIVDTAYLVDAIAQVCDKILVPKELEAAGTRRVRYSDIDFNLHTNNAKYVEWGFDAIDPTYLLNHTIEEFQINFNAESRLGDEVELWKQSLSDLEYYVEGRCNGKNIFQILIRFKA